MRSTDFRDQLVAAPLKRPRGIPTGRRGRRFPRPIGRGPIEAGSTARDRATPHWNFRDQLVAAPLKLRFRWQGSGRRRYFRDQLVAAPLKRSGRLCRRQIVDDFRDQLVAAPLKPPLEPAAELSAPLFPRPIGRGPIEAYRRVRAGHNPPHHFRDQLVAAPLKLLRLLSWSAWSA